MGSHDLGAMLLFDAAYAARHMLGEQAPPSKLRRLARILEADHAPRRQALCDEMLDSRHGQSLPAFAQVINAAGWGIIHRDSYPVAGATETQWFINGPGGALIVADTYRGLINTAVAYLCWTPGPATAIEDWRRWLPGGQMTVRPSADGSQLVWGGPLDVREGVRFRLRWLSEHGRILPTWAWPVPVCPFHAGDRRRDDAAAQVRVSSWPRLLAGRVTRTRADQPFA